MDAAIVIIGSALSGLRACRTAVEGHLFVRKTHWPEPDNSHTQEDFYHTYAPTIGAGIHSGVRPVFAFSA